MSTISSQLLDTIQRLLIDLKLDSAQMSLLHSLANTPPMRALRDVCRILDAKCTYATTAGVTTAPVNTSRPLVPFAPHSARKRKQLDLTIVDALNNGYIIRLVDFRFKLGKDVYDFFDKLRSSEDEEKFHTWLFASEFGFGGSSTEHASTTSLGQIKNVCKSRPEYFAIAEDEEEEGILFRQEKERGKYQIRCNYYPEE